METGPHPAARRGVRAEGGGKGVAQVEDSTQGSRRTLDGGAALHSALTSPPGGAVCKVGRTPKGRKGAPGARPRTTTWVLSAPIPTLASRVLSNLDQLETRLRLPTPPHPNPNLGSIPFTAPLVTTGVEARTAPSATGTGTLSGTTSPTPTRRPLGEKDLPAPTGRELYRNGLRVTRHLLTIIFPSGLTVIIVQTCLGEEPRALLPPRPGSEPAAGQSRVRARRGGAGTRRLRCSGRSRRGWRGLRGRARGATRLPEGGEGAQPGRLCVSALPASHFWGREAARPPTAGRASACSGSLAGRDGAAARRRAPRRGRPHPRARALGAD